MFAGRIPRTHTHTHTHTHMPLHATHYTQIRTTASATNCSFVDSTSQRTPALSFASTSCVMRSRSQKSLLKFTFGPSTRAPILPLFRGFEP